MANGRTNHQLEKTVRLLQSLGSGKTGVFFVTFGAPFNATDANTVKILEEDTEIQVWLYGDVKNPAGKTVLTRSAVNLESPTLVPNDAAFLEAYAKGRGAEYFVQQGHPPNRSVDRWREFVKSVDFLITLRAEFVLPRDLRPSKPH